VLSYTVNTSNKSNVVKATAEDDTVAIDITLDNANGNGIAVSNGNAVTWADGENDLTIAVTADGSGTVLYTVKVIKS
jgi:ABC-type nitrate/sulfonate/bicarbonate transport system substrate-binding protein